MSENGQQDGKLTEKPVSYKYSKEIRQDPRKKASYQRSDHLFCTEIKVDEQQDPCWLGDCILGMNEGSLSFGGE